MDIKRQIRSLILPLLHRHNFIDNIGIIGIIGIIDKKVIIIISIISTISTAFTIVKGKTIIMVTPQERAVAKNVFL